MQLFIVYFPVWKKAILLAWPVVLNHVFTTAMRTTDMLLMGFFSPAAVAAVGLGDVWERIVLRIGLALGTGSISLISQETGAARRENISHSSDVVLTQVLLTGIVIGIPFILIGWLIPEFLIALLGAEHEVVVTGGRYLLIIFSAAPFRIVSLISSRALQGTGDTKTPMAIGILSNIINIGLSVLLSLGIGPLPELGVLGVGLGTFIAKTFDAICYIIIFILPGGKLSLNYPVNGWDFTITKQLLKVAIPSSLQGGYQSLITFPFNSLVLLFGTEAAAAYHIARRIQQQLMAPLSRAYSTVTTIMAGQKLGEGDEKESQKITKGMLWLTAFTISTFAAFLFIFAPSVVELFTDDQLTIRYGSGFLRALCIGAPIFTFRGILAGLLTAAGDTRTPFYGLVVSETVFKLGFSYLLSVISGLRLSGIFIALVLDHLFQLGWVAKRFLTNKWADEARDMISERHKDF